MKVSTRSAVLLLFFLTFTYIVFSQRKNNESVEKSWITGATPFLQKIGGMLHYPKEARDNGVMGLSSFAFKVDCNNKPHSFTFKTKLGFDIEKELERTISKVSSGWLDCSKRDSTTWINVKIAFSINHLYDSKDADIVLDANGSFPGVSDEQLIQDLEDAMKKGNKEKARAAVTKLVMRFPYNQDYQKKLLELAK